MKIQQFGLFRWLRLRLSSDSPVIVWFDSTFFLLMACEPNCRWFWLISLLELGLDVTGVGRCELVLGYVTVVSV